jgi:hypothetical protein
MKQETIEELKARGENNREKAEQAEREQLKKAGQSAAWQDHFENAEQKQEANENMGRQGDAIAALLNSYTEKGEQLREARRKELQEQFTQKITRDNDNERGRGR